MKLQLEFKRFTTVCRCTSTRSDATPQHYSDCCVGKKGIERAQNRREAIAASKVQATFRGKAARDKEKLKQKAATQVQSVWRGKVAREEYEKKMDELESAEISNMAVGVALSNETHVHQLIANLTHDAGKHASSSC